MTNKVNIRPLHDRVVLRRLEQETKSSGGIVIPDSATEKPSKGVILAIGPGKTLDNGTVKALSVKVGDTVVFGKYSGNEIKIDNEEVIVMREDDIMGIIE
jgi:chaperonin GroES